MEKAQNGIRVYDICALHRQGSSQSPVIAERFSDYLKVHPNLHRAHGHSFYHLLLFTAGSGFHTIDFRRYEVRAGQLYFMAPGQVHSWNFAEGVDGYVVNFDESLFSNGICSLAQLQQWFPFLEGSTAADAVIQLPEARAVAAARIFQSIIEEAQSPAPFSSQLIAAQLLQLFVVVARAQAGQGGVDEQARQGQLQLRNFRRLLEQHYQQLRLPRDYAALLYITPNHLNAICSELLGRSAGEVIRDRVLLEAKRQLVNTEATIAGIAYSLGFADNSYFSRFFKKYAGQSPEAFRQSALQPPASSSTSN